MTRHCSPANVRSARGSGPLALGAQALRQRPALPARPSCHAFRHRPNTRPPRAPLAAPVRRTCRLCRRVRLVTPSATGRTQDHPGRRLRRPFGGRAGFAGASVLSRLPPPAEHKTTQGAACGARSEDVPALPARPSCHAFRHRPNTRPPRAPLAAPVRRTSRLCRRVRLVTPSATGRTQDHPGRRLRRPFGGRAGFAGASVLSRLPPTAAHKTTQSEAETEGSDREAADRNALAPGREPLPAAERLLLLGGQRLAATPLPQRPAGPYTEVEIVEDLAAVLVGHRAHCSLLRPCQHASFMSLICISEQEGRFMSPSSRERSPTSWSGSTPRSCSRPATSPTAGAAASTRPPRGSSGRSARPSSSCRETTTSRPCRRPASATPGASS